MKILIIDERTSLRVGSASSVTKTSTNTLLVTGLSLHTHPSHWILELLDMIVSHNSTDPRSTMNDKLNLVQMVTNLLRTPMTRSSNLITINSKETRSVLGVCTDYDMSDDKCELRLQGYMPSSPDTKFVLDTLYDKIDISDAGAPRDEDGTNTYITRINREISHIIDYLRLKVN